jgi:hypothetical protein
LKDVDINTAIQNRHIEFIEYTETGNNIPTVLNVIDKALDLGETGLHEKYQNLIELFKTTLTENFDPSDPLLPPLNLNNLKLFLIGHNTAADLSPLADFKDYKDQFDLIYKSFTTLSKPLRLKTTKVIEGKHISVYIYLRDTSMLGPAGTPLKVLGDQLGVPKLELPQGSLSNMELLLNENPDLFKAYALRDAEIALLFALHTEHFNATKVDSRVWIPTTVSTMAKNYVLTYRLKHQMAQIERFDEYHLGDMQKVLTPKGIQTTGAVAAALPLFLGSSRGGRNESFAYGFDTSQRWYDYDLTSAYTTALALAAEPNYSRHWIIPTDFKPDDLVSFINSPLLYNTYSAFVVEFQFPSDRKFPNLPVHLDKTLTVYPLEGESFANGLSLKVALDNGCKILNVKSGCVIPFKNAPYVIYDNTTKTCGVKSWDSDLDPETGNIPTLNPNPNARQSFIEQMPYYGVISELQANRIKYPKGTFNNQFYKLMGNAIYGQTAMGLAAKAVFNSRKNQMDKVGYSQLTNPVVVSWNTDFVRAVLSECLNFIEQRGGDIISCTTDGFITNLKGLDEDPSFGGGPLTAYYSLGRQLLSDSPAFLEKKGDTQGIASWCVRGQLGLEPGSKLKAMTGYQAKFKTMEELQEIVVAYLDSSNREISFMQQSLRSGKDIYTGGGAVTPKLEEKSFRLIFDNRRRVIPHSISQSVTHSPTPPTSPTSPTTPTTPTNSSLPPDTEQFKGILLLTEPWQNADVCKTALSIAKLGRDKYAKNTNYPIKGSRPKNYKQMAVNQFLRAVLQKKLIDLNRPCGYVDPSTNKFVVEGHDKIEDPFKFYREWVVFFEEHGVKINKKAIANHARTSRPFIPKSVPRVPQTEEFLNAMKDEFNRKFGILIDLNQFYLPEK